MRTPRRLPIPLQRSLGWLLPLGAVVHLLLALRAGGQPTVAELQRLEPGLLVLAALAALAPPFLHAVRVRAWLRRLGGASSLGDSLRIVAAAEVGAAWTPSALGGAPVKSAMLVGRGCDMPTSVAVTTLGSLEDLAFNLVVALPALALSGVVPAWPTALPRPAGPPSAAVWASFLAIAAVLILFGLSGTGRRVRRRAAEGWSRIRAALVRAGRQGRDVLLINVLLSCVQWTIRYSLLPLLALGLGVDLPWLEAAVLQWIGYAFCTLVPTPGATGGAEAAFAALYADLMPRRDLVLLLPVWRLVTFYWVLVAASGVLAATASRRVSRQG